MNGGWAFFLGILAGYAIDSIIGWFDKRREPRPGDYNLQIGADWLTSDPGFLHDLADAIQRADDRRREALYAGMRPMPGPR